MRKEDTEQIKEVFEMPGWDLIKADLDNLLRSADRRIHQADRDTIDYARGYYDCAILVRYLPERLAQNPTLKIGTTREGGG